MSKFAQKMFPRSSFVLKITADLKLTTYSFGVKVTDFYTRNLCSNDLNTCSSLRNVIEHLDGVKEMVSSDKDFLDEVSEKLEEKFDDNTKVKFLSEQMILPRMLASTHHHHYWQWLYCFTECHRVVTKKMYEDDFLTLPSPDHLRRLSSAINVDTLTLSESTAAYRKARLNKLDDRERLIAILMDEVYSQQKGKYVNGNF